MRSKEFEVQLLLATWEDLGGQWSLDRSSDHPVDEVLVDAPPVFRVLQESGIRDLPRK